MSLVFYGLMAAAFVMAAWGQIQGLTPSPMEALGTAAMQAADQAVTLGLGLIGALSLFLGVMKVAESAGALAWLARLLRPLLTRLFPSIPAEDPTLGAMLMNVAANMVGLSNAATPFGLRAMRGLDRLNPSPGTASNAMVLFLALNTANVTLLPTHVMALRTAVGSHQPAVIVGTTLLSTAVAMAVALLAAGLGGRIWPNRPVPLGETAIPAAELPTTTEADSLPALTEATPPLPLWQSLCGVIGLVAGLGGMIWGGPALSPWILPSLIIGVLTLGLIKRVPLYPRFVDGAREGLTLSLQILPALVAILTAIGMVRASGAMAALLGPLSQWTAPLGLPAEALTMVVLRSLSGSASFGYLAALLKDPAIGPDSPLGILLSTIYGSSETTFYVLAVYFGVTRVRSLRHALLVGVLADLGGAVGAVLACRWLVG